MLLSCINLVTCMCYIILEQVLEDGLNMIKLVYDGLIYVCNL